MYLPLYVCGFQLQGVLAGQKNLQKNYTTLTLEYLPLSLIGNNIIRVLLTLSNRNSTRFLQRTTTKDLLYNSVKILLSAKGIAA